MELSSYAYTSVGGRDENQDSVAARESEGCGIYLVADGLGGHQNGKEASLCVADVLTGNWEKEKPKEVGNWLEEKISEANRKILEKQKETRSSMKSTVVSLLICGDTACWAHSGDSRLYHFRDGAISSVTEDHSYAYRKYKIGEISRRQIASDPDQSSVLKSLGNEKRWEPVVAESKVAPGDAFLLCSDGLWEFVSDEEMLADWLKSDDPRTWAELILLRVISRVKPKNDNLSIVTVMVK